MQRASGDPLFNTLCLEDDGFPGQPKAEFPNQIVLDASNQPINVRRAGKYCAITPWGTVDRTWTNAHHHRRLVQGDQRRQDVRPRTIISQSAAASTTAGSDSKATASWDTSIRIFRSVPMPASPGTGTIVHTLGNIGFARSASNCVEHLLRHLRQRHLRHHHPAVGDCGRTAQRRARSPWPICSAPAPTSAASTPSSGSIRWRASPTRSAGAMTFYGGYSEANRAPTPLELGCSNPSKPCLLEGFLVSDPPLNQVVAQARTRSACAATSHGSDGRIEWKLGLFRTDSQSDIIQRRERISGHGACSRTSPRPAGRAWKPACSITQTGWLVYAN